MAVLGATLLACSSPPEQSDKTGDTPDASTEGSADADLRDTGPEPFDSGTTGPVKIVFASSTRHTADLGGDTGADGICADLALDASLDGEFRAWVSTTTASAESRLAHATVPYALTTGARVADDWDDFIDGSLASPINRDETGAAISGDVWTGTEADGSISSEGTCAGFTNGTSGAGRCGASGQSNAAWTSNLTPSCSTQLRIYCIEQ